MSCVGELGSVERPPLHVLWNAGIKWYQQNTEQTDPRSIPSYKPLINASTDCITLNTRTLFSYALPPSNFKKKERKGKQYFLKKHNTLYKSQWPLN